MTAAGISAASSIKALLRPMVAGTPSLAIRRSSTFGESGWPLREPGNSQAPSVGPPAVLSGRSAIRLLMRSPNVDLPRPQPPAPFGDPHRRMVVEPKPGPAIDQVVFDGLGGPGHHGRHHPPLRRRPSGAFPVADVQHAELAQFGCFWVSVPVGPVEFAGLVAAQAFSGGS